MPSISHDHFGANRRSSRQSFCSHVSEQTHRYRCGQRNSTSIQQILEEPRVYHLRHATLRGIVRDVQSLAPYTVPNGDNCYGAYLFRLEDDEATIPVAVLGICGRPIIRDPEVEDGDRVEVSATIQAPSHGGYYLSFKGLKVVTEQEGVVQAVADRILPIVE